MANSGSFSATDPHYGGRLDFKYTASKTGPGVTQVSWTLTANGRSSYPRALQTRGSLYVNGSWVWSGPNDLIYYTGNELASGSFNVTHSTSGAGSFEIEFKDIYIYSIDTRGEGTHSFSLDTNYPYSDCVAPEDVWVADVSTNGQATVTWTGASGGTANPITGYLIYYSKTNPVTENDNYVKSYTTSTSGSYIVSGLDRGCYYYFRIKTLGAHGNSYLSSDQTWTWMNRWPNTPQYSQVRIAYKETMGVPNVWASDPDNDNFKLQYGRTWEEWADYAPGTKIYPDQTYDFRAVDEHGEASYKLSAIPVVRNPKPTMTISTKGTISLESAQNSTEKSYARDIQISVTGNTGTSEVDIYAYHIYYQTSIDGKVFSDRSYLTSFYVNSTSHTGMITLTNAQVPRNTYFRIVSKMETKNYGDLTDDCIDSTVYYVPPAPKIRKMYNNFSSNSLEYSSNHFYNRMRIYFDYDEDITNINIILVGEKTISIGSVDMTSKGNLTANGYSDFYLPETLTPGEYYQVKATFSSKHTSDTFTSEKIRMARRIDMVYNLDSSNKQIKPYTEENLSFSLRNPYNSTSINYPEFYIKDSKAYRFFFVNGEGEAELPVTLSPKTSIDTFYFDVDCSQLLSKIRTKLVADGINSTGVLRADVVDIFGRKFTNSITINMDLREPIVGVSNFAVTINDQPLSSESFLYRGDKVEFSYSVIDYNRDNVQIVIQKSETDDDSEPTEWKTQITTNLQLSSYGEYKVAKTTSGKVSYIIGEITTKKYIRYRVLVRDTVSEKTSAWSTAGVIRVAQVPATVEIIGYSLDEKPQSSNKMITINYHISDLGINPSQNLGNAEAYCEYYTDLIEPTIDKQVSPITSTGNFSIKLDYSLPPEANYIMVRVHVNTYTENSTHVGNHGKKQSSTVYIIVPNTLATYSYRKNQFGINTNALDINESVALLIGYKKDKNTIVFQGPEGRKYVFNLDDGTMDGFTLNGGSW